MIAGICHVKNEIDVIELVVRHTVAEGVDHLWVQDHMSSDGTCDLLWELGRDLPITLLHDLDPVFYQPERMNELAQMAREAGAEWIVPFDADEFFYAPSGRTVADELRDYTGVQKVYCQSWRYLDFNRHDWMPQRDKVVFRPSPDAWLIAGNHDVTTSGVAVRGPLEIAHLQYRSPEQFIAKINGLTAYEPLFAVQGRPALLGKSDEELSAEYDALCAVETVVAPIPLRVPGAVGSR